MTISREEIDKARTSKGGWTRQQLAKWGVPWPPPKGWLRSLLQPQIQTLIVMRTADMVLVHPETDYSRVCAQCSEPVGIYPSGQAVIRVYGIRHMRIVCNRCVDSGEASIAQPAPGALAEVGQSVRRQR